MYKRIKENIISPSKLINRKDDKFGISFLYLLMLIVALSLPSIVQSISFTSLHANTRTALKVALEDQLDVGCSIDYGLVCETDDEQLVELPAFNVIFDPAGTYLPVDFGIKLVLREENAYVYSAKQILMEFDYGNMTDSYQEWPVEWSVIDIDTESDIFWEELFNGIDRVMVENRGIWIPVIIISTVFAFTMILLTEIVLDTLILSIFKIGKLKFKQTFKIVLNAMTLYVIIRVILELYNINISGIMQSIFQMIPLTYALISIRNPLKR